MTLASRHFFSSLQPSSSVAVRQKVTKKRTPLTKPVLLSLSAEIPITRYAGFAQTMEIFNRILH